MSYEEIVQELESLDKVYLYRTKNVKDKVFVVEEGSLKANGRYLNLSKNHDMYILFYPVKEDGHKYNVRVSVTEGKIHSGYFWLRERDDDRAIDILIADAEERIKSYERMIENKEKYIKELCGMK